MGTASEPEEESAELVRQRRRKRKPHLGRLMFFRTGGVRGKIQGGSDTHNIPKPWGTWMGIPIILKCGM